MEGRGDGSSRWRRCTCSRRCTSRRRWEATLAQLYEAWDGSGTPQGAHGEDIAIGARILAAVDSWLDLTRNPANTFGRLFTREQALGFMAEQAGTLFDPRVVEMVELLHSG